MSTWSTKFNKIKQNASSKRKKDSLGDSDAKRRRCHMLKVSSCINQNIKRVELIKPVIKNMCISNNSEIIEKALHKNVFSEFPKDNFSAKVTVLKDFSKSNKLSNKITMFSQNSMSDIKCTSFLNSLSDVWLKKCEFADDFSAKVGKNHAMCSLNSPPFVAHNKEMKDTFIEEDEISPSASASKTNKILNSQPLENSRNNEFDQDNSLDSDDKNLSFAGDNSGQNIKLQNHHLTSNDVNCSNNFRKVKKSAACRKKTSSKVVHENYVNLNLRKRCFVKSNHKAGKAKWKKWRKHGYKNRHT